MEQIITENFPNLVNRKASKSRRHREASSKIHKNRSTPCHLIVKLTSLSDKEKILKVARDKRSITYNNRNIRLAVDLSTETWQDRKNWHNIFRALNEKNMQSRIPYPATLH